MKEKNIYRSGLTVSLCGDRFILERWYRVKEGNQTVWNTDNLIEIELQGTPSLVVKKNWKSLAKGQNINNAHVSIGIPRRRK